MPHKRNPAGSVVALAAAARVPGLVAAFLAAMPQEHERAAGGWQSEWPYGRGMIAGDRQRAGRHRRHLDGLTVDPARMRANIDGTPRRGLRRESGDAAGAELGRSAAQSA